jgi:hypothetical protein
MAVLAGALIAVVPATAQAAAHKPLAALNPHAPAPNHKIGHSSSTNWSGYAVSGAGPYNSVSASWTQPAVDCSQTPTGYSSFWVGLDGDTTNTVEQTGTEADCSSGKPVYYGWYEMYPKFPVNYSNPVSPGDAMSASVTYLGSGQFRLTLSDATQGWSKTTQQRLNHPKLGSAEVIAEAPSSSGGVLPLADFGSVNFSAATANGASMAKLSGLDPITMASSSGTIKAKPSSMSISGSFSDTWYGQ